MLQNRKYLDCAACSRRAAITSKIEERKARRTTTTKTLVVASVIALLPAMASADSTHVQRQLNVRYTIAVARILVGSLTLAADIRENEYRISANGRVSNVAQVLTSGEGNSTAHGSIANGRLMPKSFASSSTFPGDPPAVNIEFENGNVIKLDAAPGQDRVPLNDSHKKGVIDPLTAMLVLSGDTDQDLSEAACHRTLQVFDGHQRYDLILAFKRKETVKIERGYSGTVVVCSGFYKPIAGHRMSAPLVKFLFGREIEIILAPVASTRLAAPLRITVHSWFANLVIEASGFK